MAGHTLHPILALPVREPARVTCDCGVSTTVDLVAVIDVAGEAELAEQALNDELNHSECEECDAKLQASRPVVVFDWEAQAVFVLLARDQRQTGLTALGTYLTRLAQAVQGEALPAFASRPMLAFGGRGLAAARERLERDRLVTSAGADEALEEASAALEQERRELEIRSAELEQREESVSGRERGAQERFEELGARTDELKAIESELEAKGEEVQEAAREIEAKGDALEQVRRALERQVMEAASSPTADPAPEEREEADPAEVPEAEAEDEAPGASVEQTEEAPTGEDDAEPEADAEAAPEPPARAESWDQALDSEWVLGDEENAADTVATPAVQIVDGPTESGGDSDRTVRFQTGEHPRTGKPKQVEVVAPRPAVGPFATFDGSRAGDGDQYWVIEDGDVYLCLQRAEGELSRLLSERLDLRFQVHRPEQGAACSLTLATLTHEGEGVEAAWFVDAANDDDRRLLNALAESFKPLLILFDEEGDPQRMLPFERPLEDNVVVGLDRAEAWVAGHDRAGFQAAVEVVTSDAFDVLGGKVHPFHNEAFHHIGDAARARFAVNVVEYWSAGDNRDYLLLTKAFPAVELREIVRRTVEAAVEFGVALGEGLTDRALAIEAAPSRRELVRSQLASFAEVALRLKPGGLDEVGEWENWEALLEQAEECSVSVDSSILGLAESAMERVKSLMDGGGKAQAPAQTGENKAATPPPPPPPSAADPGRPPGMRPSDATQEIDPDLDAELFLDSDDEETDLADKSSKDLAALLDSDDGAEAAHAAMVIVARADREIADALVTRVRSRGDDKGRTRALECLASMGEVAVAAVTEGVKSRKRGDEKLDDAVAVLVRAVGKARVERMKRDRSRKVRDAARRVLKRLADGQTDPGTREQEAVANAFLGGGAPAAPDEKQEDASA